MTLEEWLEDLAGEDVVDNDREAPDHSVARRLSSGYRRRTSTAIPRFHDDDMPGRQAQLLESIARIMDEADGNGDDEPHRETHRRIPVRRGLKRRNRSASAFDDTRQQLAELIGELEADRAHDDGAAFDDGMDEDFEHVGHTSRRPGRAGRTRTAHEGATGLHLRENRVAHAVAQQMRDEIASLIAALDAHEPSSIDDERAQDELNAVKSQLGALQKIILKHGRQNGVAALDPALRAEIAQILQNIEDIRDRQLHQVNAADLWPSLRSELSHLQENVRKLATRDELTALDRAVRELSSHAARALSAGHAPMAGSEPLAALKNELSQLYDRMSALATRGELSSLQETVRADVAKVLDQVGQFTKRHEHEGKLIDLWPSLRGEIGRLQEAMSGLASHKELASLEKSVRDLASAANRNGGDANIQRLIQPIERLRADMQRLVATVASSPKQIEASVKAALASDFGAEVPGVGRQLDELHGQIRKLGSRQIDAAEFAGLKAMIQEIGDTIRGSTSNAGSHGNPEMLAAISGLGRQLELLSQKIDHSAATPFALGMLQGDEGQQAVVDFGKKINLISHKLDILSKTHALDVVQQIEDLSGKVDRLAAQGADRGQTASALARLSDRIDEALSQNTQQVVAGITERLDLITAMIGGRNEKPDLSALEENIRALAENIENARGADLDKDALDVLQAQIAGLAKRLDQSQSGSALGADIARMLGALDQSMQALSADVDALRHDTVNIADRAARVAISDTLGALPMPSATGTVDRGLDQIRQLHEAAERRAQDTLEAVHDTLVHVVERLSALEARQTAVSKATEAKKAPVSKSPVSGAALILDSLKGKKEASLDIGLTRDQDKVSTRKSDTPARTILPQADTPIEPGAGRPIGAVASAKPAAFATEHPNDVKASFIAAARRAAQAAAAEAAASSGTSVRGRISPDAKTRPAGSPGTLEQIKGKAGVRRKSILLGIAAIVLAAGVTQIVSSGVEPGLPNLLADGMPGNTTGNTPVKPVAKVAAVPHADINVPLPKEPANPFLDHKPDQKTAANLDRLTRETGSITPEKKQTSPAQAAQSQPPGKSVEVASLPPQPPLKEAPQMAPIAGMAAFGHLPGGPKLAGLHKAVHEGNPLAVYDMAARLAEGRDVPRDLKLAAQLFSKVADAGLAPAQYRLGSLYEKGLGVKRDPATAEKWYERAASQGNARAMHNLAVLLAEGAGGKPDYAAAAQWFGKAAELGVRDSQYNLAILLARGLGVKQDLVHSYTWFNAAAAQGDKDAASKRDEVAKRLSQSELAIARAAAAAWHAKTPLATANEVKLPEHGWGASAEKSSAQHHKATGAKV